ncbi:DUF1659 domain-containing protein [Bacillus sp. FJAT-45350]|uniref:DUF1659 domain-containing protein n=1 Tax=Bacillus sp. FJAT-45350 TaxID=2011014 RepID=UPI000BB74BDA|nr:DUF1659 domain-containing protein [Bacillus sp. FJAT-45350]
MAMISIERVSLVLVVSEGIDLNGEPIYKRRTYNNVKDSVTPQSVLTVGNALSSLSTDMLDKIQTNQLTAFY